MISKLLAWLRKKQTYFIIFAAEFVLILLIGLAYSAPWTGFGDFTKPNGEFVRGKTLWDWMQLFLVPLTLSVGVFFLNRAERDNERQRSEERNKLERDIATDRQHEAALQAYFEKMFDLLLKDKLLTEVRYVARTRTLTVLRGLDVYRKGLVVNFLHEARLIDTGDRIVNLTGADLGNIELVNANLKDVDLAGTSLYNSKFKKSNLENANLEKVDLGFSNFYNANLTNANLQGVDLGSANLKGANLTNANLQNASLKGANLIGANLTNANLKNVSMGAHWGRSLGDIGDDEKSALGILNPPEWLDSLVDSYEGPDERRALMKGTLLDDADLSYANLEGAEVTEEQLAKVKSLKGAIMPDGTKHD